MSLSCNNYENLNILTLVWEMIRPKECVNLEAERSWKDGAGRKKTWMKEKEETWKIYVRHKRGLKKKPYTYMKIERETEKWCFYWKHVMSVHMCMRLCVFLFLSVSLAGGDVTFTLLFDCTLTVWGEDASTQGAFRTMMEEETGVSGETGVIYRKCPETNTAHPTDGCKHEDKKHERRKVRDSGSKRLTKNREAGVDRWQPELQPRRAHGFERQKSSGEAW